MIKIWPRIIEKIRAIQWDAVTDFLPFLEIGYNDKPLIIKSFESNVGHNVSKHQTILIDGFVILELLILQIK